MEWSVKTGYLKILFSFRKYIGLLYIYIGSNCWIKYLFSRMIISNDSFFYTFIKFKADKHNCLLIRERRLSATSIYIIDSNSYRAIHVLYTRFRRSVNILTAPIHKTTMMQAEAKSSTSLRLMLLMMLTIPRKTLANVCIASMHKSLRKQITWKIWFLANSCSLRNFFRKVYISFIS